MHTKKSLHRKDGIRWRKNIFNSLLGSPYKISQIINYLYEHDNVAMVAPDGCISRKWGRGNKKSVRRLLHKLNIDYDLDQTEFVAGSMFWVKSSILKLIQEINFSPSDFEIESGQLDDTLSHHIERLIGILIRRSNF